MSNLSLIRKMLNDLSLEERQERTSTNSEFSQPQSKEFIIEAKNNTRHDLVEFALVKLVDNSVDKSAILLFEYPDTDDDPETTIYGSLQDQTYDGQTGHVKFSGNTFLSITTDRSSKIVAGEKLYPLNTSHGKVGNKSSGTSDIINICIGKAIRGQESDSTIISVNIGHISSEGSKFDIVEAATTTAIVLSGNQTIDEVLCGAKTLVLVKNQLPSSQNGLYRVETGDWTRISEPDVIFVKNGTKNGRLIYTLISTHTYRANCGVYG